MKRAKLKHRRVFDDEEWAQGYYDRHRKWALRSAREFIERLGALGVSKGRILDAGCGFGLMAIEIAKALPDMTVTGVDLSEPLLRIAKGLADEVGMSDRVTFEKRDVSSTGFMDDSFDVVLCMYVLHLVEEPTAMLNEIERLLTPGGILLLKDLKRSWLGHFDNAIATSYTRKEAEEILKASNLRTWTLKNSIMHIEVKSG